MASASENLETTSLVNKEEPGEFCTIEASVVTGFEECARGEAKEKFGTDVKTSRGKIIWKIPLERLHEVLNMGSIDNCRVVMHTVPHFKFSDQNGSLARLQQMILDVDWESGLKAWKKLFDFPHPIASHPDRIPSPEELVDVVVMTRLPQPKDKAEKKKKNQGKGRGRKKDKENKGHFGDNKEKCIQNERETDKAERHVDESSLSKGDNSVTLSNVTENQGELCDQSKLGTMEGTESLDKFDPAGGDSIGLEMSKEEDKSIVDTVSVMQKSYQLAPPKTVVIKQMSSSEKEPEVEIKVLNPSPIDNAFPTVLDSKDLRHLEPMEVDSPNASFRASNLLEPEGENLAETDSDSVTSSSLPTSSATLHQANAGSGATAHQVNDAESHTPVHQVNTATAHQINGSAHHSDGTPVSDPSDAAAAFATSLIHRLSTPPASPLKTGQASAVCTTPPSTPIVTSMENPFLSVPVHGTTSVPLENEIDQKNDIAHCGSSVDPVSCQKETSGSSPALHPQAVAETSFSTSDTAASTIAVENLSLTEASGAVITDQESEPDKEGTLVNTSQEVLSTESVSLEKPSSTILLEQGDLQSNQSKDLFTAKTPAKEISTESDSSPKEVQSIELSEPENAQSNQDKDKAAAKISEKEQDTTKPKFRVSCNRVGDHPFDSSSAAASFGSAVITYFKWPVDLKNYDIEVLLNIDNEEVSVSLALTRSSLHNRNVVAFGPTTLRATICYNMLRLSRIKNGDFICDPMCGTSAIPIESALNWTNCYTFGGDFHEKAIERTAANIGAIQSKQAENKKSHLKLDAVQWNIEHFPLRDACVDVFVSDLPFGHRLGSRTVNRTLYPCLLSEMARTARPGARACLLTEDRTSLVKAIQTFGKLWQRRLVQSVNIGGLSGFVFVLIRTTASMREEVNQAPAAAAPLDVSPPSPVKPAA